jgi:hypothetical protein
MTDLNPAAVAPEMGDFSLLDQPSQQRGRHSGAAAVLVHDKDHGVPSMAFSWRLLPSSKPSSRHIAIPRLSDGNVSKVLDRF